MPFNGSGGFVAVAAPDYPAVAGTKIRAAQFNTVIQDLMNGLSNAITKDGQQVITANIPMEGFKFTGLGNGSAAGNSLAFGQEVGQSGLTFAAGVVGAPSIAPTGDLNTGMWFPAADQIAWSIGGAEAFRTNSTGFGIGVSPTVFVHTGKTQNAATVFQHQNLSNGASALARFRLDGDASALILEQYSSGHASSSQAGIYTTTANGWFLGTGGASRVVLAGDGGSFYPTTTNVTSIGGSANRWSTVYGVAGNFSGAVTAVGVNVGGALATATTGAFSGAVSMAALTATTGTFSGAMSATTGTFSGAVAAASGFDTAKVTSGEYTPTGTAVTNIDSVTPGVAHWIRVHDRITVVGQVTADNTAAAATEIALSLPVASDFALDTNAAGVGAIVNGADAPATLIADATNNRIRMIWLADDTSSHDWRYTYTYKVL